MHGIGRTYIRAGHHQYATRTQQLVETVQQLVGVRVVLEHVPQRYDIESTGTELVHLVEVNHAVVEHLERELSLLMIFLYRYHLPAAALHPVGEESRLGTVVEQRAGGAV